MPTVPNVWWLKIRMYLLVVVLFGIIYALVSAVSFYLGITNFIFYGALAFGMTLLQYLIGPSIVGWSMGVKYVSEKEEPELHAMVERLAKKSGIPKPRIGISKLQIPNAFAFGRWKSDGRICFTQGILDLLSKKELEAVAGHELSHLKHRDVAVITLISVIPMIAWYVAQSFIWGRHDRNNGGGAVAVGILAFVIYFVTNLLVLYASRIREYYADAGSVTLGNEPHSLASALYKLVYGSAKCSRHELKKVEGMKAFFANDISRAHHDIQELAALDLDKSGHIDAEELAHLSEKHIKLSGIDKMMEVMSTHPNMLKRIKILSSMR
ncbi:MAG: M48 family metalloprotease [DPANN group archaeon]|nr:M48 family metalloprotease [DPANN group archaeon]